nr:putative ribonuclease H-like domain-containing protein [Tanacetum cinerariifolium]
MQQPMLNPEDITDPTAAMNMALALMAKAFKLNYSTPTNNNQIISSNPRNRQIAQPGMNLGQDNQIQMVGGNEGNQFRQYVRQNVRNQIVQNPGVQNVRNHNGVIVVLGIANQNMNGNVVAARAEGNTVENNDNQIRCYNYRGLGYLARNCTIRPRRKDQASKLGTQTDKAPVYESDISVEKDSNVISEAPNVEQGGRTVEQHPVTIEETHSYHESVFHNLATEVEKVNSEKSTVSSLQEEKKRLKADFKIREDELLDKLENKIKELYNILVKTGQSFQTMHMLLPKPDSFYHTKHKMALGYQNPCYLKQAQQKQQSLYNGKVLLEKHDPPTMHYSEETLEFAQENTSNLQTELEHTKEHFENYIIKKENEYAKLWNDWYKKYEECKYDKISYDKAYNDMQQKIKRLQAQLGDLKGKSKDTSCVSDTLDPLPQKLDNENVKLEFLVQNYEKENAHLKTAYKNLFDSVNVPQKVDTTNDLSNPVTSNSVPTTQESKVVDNEKVIALGMSTINPFKNTREEKSLPNKPVNASVRKNPITDPQPHVITKKVVNFDSHDKISRDVITVGSTMRIPLLYRGEYSQWRERFMNSLEEQTYVAGNAQNAPPTLKDLKFWTAEEKKTRKIDRLAGSLLIQGLPNDIYSLIDSKETAKDLWDALESKNLMDINIDALYNILEQNQGYVNDALGYKKKAIVITSDPLALAAEKINSANKKQEFIKMDDTKVEKKADEKKRDMSKVKCYNCKKEGHFAKDCKKAKVKDYNYYKTKMLLAKKDGDEQVLLAEDQTWMESISDYDKEINANMVFMAQIEKVLSESNKSSSSTEENIAEVAYYTSESESESEFKTSKYYDHSTNYDYDKSEVDHNDSEEKEHLVDRLIQKFNHKIAKCQKRVEKANQQNKDFENQNKDLQENYDALINQVNTFEEQKNEFNEQIKVLNEKNVDLLAQTKVLQDQLKVKHVVIDTHVECHEKYAKLKAERYEYMIRYSALFGNDKQHRKQIVDQEVLFDKMSVELVELDKHVRDLKNTVLEKDFKISELEECVRNKYLEIEKCLERLNVCENKIHKMGQTNQTVHMIMPSKDTLYNGRKGIGFKNPRYFEKGKDLRPSLYDEKVIGLGYTLMFLTHSDEALEIEKFKRSRENKIEFAYDYRNLNASYVNEKINFKDDYFQEIINPDFEKIDSPFQQTKKANMETIESLKSKGFESSENEISESENQSENDCHVDEKECDKVENSKVIAPRRFKLNVSQSVSPISMTKTLCDSKNVENLDTVSSVRRPKYRDVIWKKKWSSNTSNVDLSSVSHLKLNKDVKRYSRKDLCHIVQICLWIIDSGCSKHMTGNRALLTNFVEKFLGTVRFGNNDFVLIAGYGDVVIGSMMIKKFFYVEGLGHNLFSVGQFCDKGLEVAFRKSTCFVRNEYGVDLLSSDRSSNLYIIALNEVASNSSTCLLAKASSSQSWLGHQRLSHLNFATINNLVKNNIVQDLPKMKFEKDHLCSACEQGKIHQKHHKSKTAFASNKPLYLLHMDLCGPIHIQSLNGKRYVLVVVNDYSRYTWVFFLHSKDEASDVIISFIKKTQVNLQLQVQGVRTDNGTEFKNKTLAKFFDEVGITQQFSAARTPQQNGVVERRNRTLVEAARTMLTFANLPLFLWAEAIATACFTQNHLFQDFYDEYFDSSKIMKSSTTNVETSINEEVFHEVSESFQGKSSSSSLNDDVQQSQDFDALPTDEEIVSFLKEIGHTREINSLNDVVVGHMHQPWRTFTALINKTLFGKTTGKSKRVKRPAKKSTKALEKGIVIRETLEMPLTKKKEKLGVTQDNENESNSEHETDESKSGSESDHKENEEDEDDKEEMNYEFVKTLSNDFDNEDETKIADKAEGEEDEEMYYTTIQLYADVDIRLNKPVDTDKAPEHKECYEGLKKSYELDTTIFSTYDKVYSLKISQKYKDKDEDPSAGSDRGLKKRKTSKDAEPKKDSDMPQDQEKNPSNDDEEPKEKVASESDWFTKPTQPQEPTDPDWDVGKTPHQGQNQNWLMTLASFAKKPSKTFVELTSTLIDFSTFIMNGLNINNLTQETLLGPAFRLLKVTRPIMLITQVEVMRKHGYGYLQEIVVRITDNDLYGFKDGDFPRLRINDIKDMLLLVVQNRLTNHPGDDIFDFTIALRMFTRSFLIQNDGTLTRLGTSLGPVQEVVDSCRTGKIVDDDQVNRMRKEVWNQSIRYLASVNKIVNYG